MHTESAPPMDVVATRFSSSSPVEVSWSPPSSGADIITRYRIFYGNGQSVLVPSYVTRIVLNFIDQRSQVENVSMWSESLQALPSELVTVMVTSPVGTSYIVSFPAPWARDYVIYR